MESREMGMGFPETHKEITTVRDIKDKFYTKFGKGENLSWSEEQRSFFDKLNKLGGRNIDKMPPETVPDIDATVELSDEEVNELEKEMNSL